MARFDDTERLRQRVAQEAARIIADQGIENYRQAKLKAAANLSVNGKAALPGNCEIEAALIAHQSLFGASEHAEHIRSLRRDALRAMELLRPYSPRLVGPVLSGTAGPGSPVNLHVFADTPEEVLWCVEAAGLSVSSFERRLKDRRDCTSNYPGYRFCVGAATIEATVFKYDGLRQAPISPVNGKPMRRASHSQVAALIQS